ncbi:MAG: ATP-binding protein, partial [Acidobacteriota bacterium]
LVSGVRNQAWWFASVEDHEGKRAPALLVAGTDGLYEIQGDTARPVKAPSDGTFRSATLLTSRLDPSRVWVGLFDGLASFRWRGGAWVDEGRVVGIPDQVRSLYENPDGSLWAGTQVTGLLRVRFDTRPAPDTPRPQASVERYGIEQGLPAGAIFVHSAAGAPYFRVGGDQPYVARFDDQSRQFVRQPAFEQVSVNLRTAGFGLEEGPDGRMFVNFGRETAVMRHQADGTWTIDKAPFSRFGSDGSFVIYPEADGVVWFSASGGRLVRFDTSRSQAAPATPRTLIRRVTLNDGQALFGGFPETAAAPRLSPSSKALRFEFAAPSFASATPPEFQSMLAGLDTDWSAFTREARRDYTNLGLGDYRFRVRARSAAGTLTEEAVYAFTILPPWYRTWWAYGSYVILLAGLVFVVDRVQRRRVIARERVRAEFNEARLRAESAEALANAESERKRNVELLSEIGREITASLDFDTIFLKLYERVNELADADVFGVGLYHPDRHQIEYRLAVEAGKRYAPYTRDTTERNQLPVWCIEHRQAVFINDVGREAVQYVANYTDPRRQLEDGSYSRAPESIIYLPLETKDRVLGIITIQSFEKNAYTEYDLNVLQSLASYTSVALDNADAYRQLNEHELEIRRLFEEAQQARAAAEQADAAKSAFLSTVSHELRTPLTSVLGFAKIIKKRLEERIFPLIQTDDRKIVQTMQQVEENLKVVVSEGERLTKLIDDVLDLAKIEAGKLEWHMESVTVADIISRATSATAALFEQTGLHLVTEVADGLPAVHGDRDRLIQVLINLISNAVKFTSAGQVTCRAVRDDGRIVVSVIDTGMGIAPADQPKVFERFKQVGDTLTDKPKGTGLGLPICREIVEHHGGRVWVESEFGKGSTFSFSLPVARDLSAARGPIDLPSLVRQLRDQVVVTTPRAADRESRILVVDDDANIRELLKQELEEAGYRVRLATNGREGLAEIRRERPDLVILDVMMPEMNGFDVAAVLKNDPATTDLPILILSIVQDKERGYRLGVDRYLTKPIDTELLFKEVGSLIEQGKSKKRVLVVDEDQSTVRTLSDVLTTRGYSVINAQGEDVVQRAIAMQPDIILLSSLASQRSELVQTLRFEKGLENVLFFVYQ